MTKRMLIDATHAEETRVVVADGHKLEEFDTETSTKRQLKGNIYLAKVTRVEPSLQAAFVDYGGNRHGFLAFNEIHPDYFRIPVEDREALLADAAAAADDEEAAEAEGDSVEVLGGDESDEIERVGEAQRSRLRNLTRQYRIQEVIKRRQILLVQVVKEERGNKGAALTTYLSLAGRYCVLMPNTARGGGISRKITSPAHRKRLKSILSSLEVPDGMAVILRTAGVERSRAEMRRDYEYLRRTWDEIRELTLQSTAPALIYEEGNLIKRSLRDLYTREIEEVIIDGDEAYKSARALMRTMIPSHARRIQKYGDNAMPLFNRYKIEGQLDAIHEHTVNLPAGGYIVINPTEALVAIDVNSGRATRERNIEQTARRTNLEAAEEVARQLRLRDLAGLIVIDFIDMEDAKNNAAVERRLKEAMKNDRARIQVGRISPFGLLELSRQRLRPSLAEANAETCPTCGGTGFVRSTESAALKVLRGIEEECLRQRAAQLVVRAPANVALYLLNQKRATLNDISARHEVAVTVNVDDSLIPPAYELERVRGDGEASGEDGVVRQGDTGRGRREGRGARDGERDDRGRRRRRRSRDDATEAPAEPAVAADEADDAAGGEEEPRRRRRGRRGGRRRRRDGEVVAEAGAETEAGAEGAGEQADEAEAVGDVAAAAEADAAVADADGDGESAGGNGRRRRRTRGGRRRRSSDSDSAAEAAGDDAGTEDADEAVAAEADAAEAAEDAEKPARRSRSRRGTRGGRGRTRKAKDADAVAEADDNAGDDVAAAEVEAGTEETSGEEDVAAFSVVETPVVELPPSVAEGEDEDEAPALAVAAVNGNATDHEEAANDTGDEGAAEDMGDDPDPDRPRRRGWWNRFGT